MSTNSVVGAGLADRFDRRDERVRDGDDRVALADAGGHQREPHGVGAVGHADAVLGAAVGRELALECLDLRPADECGRSDRLAERGDQLFFELAVRGDQIEERNRLRGHQRLLSGAESQAHVVYRRRAVRSQALA